MYLDSYIVLQIVRSCFTVFLIQTPFLMEKKMVENISLRLNLPNFFPLNPLISYNSIQSVLQTWEFSSAKKNVNVMTQFQTNRDSWQTTTNGYWRDQQRQGPIQKLKFQTNWLETIPETKSERGEVIGAREYNCHNAEGQSRTREEKAPQ